MSFEVDGLSVVIPAHNESAVLPRLLRSIAPHGLPDHLDVLVVANGCTDSTADVASQFQGVRVIEISVASKMAAIREGDNQAQFAARAYVDADVVINQSDLVQIFRCLTDRRALAAAPRRVLMRGGVSPAVSWYYDIWERLPQVKAGLFGRGVIVLSADGHRRARSLPQVMSDDLMLSEAFTPDERLIVPDAEVSIWLPRTTRDLIRRRTRVATGNAEIDEMGRRNHESRTSVDSLIGVVRNNPALLPKMVVFVGVTLIARVRAKRMVRKRDFTTWLRDESSRS